MPRVVSFKILLCTFFALAVLTFLTVLAAGTLVPLLIAVIKASLVLLIFMHLFWDNRFYALIFISCLIFVALFIGLALLDSSQYQGSIKQQQAPGVKHVPMGDR